MWKGRVNPHLFINRDILSQSLATWWQRMSLKTDFLLTSLATKSNAMHTRSTIWIVNKHSSNQINWVNFRPTQSLLFYQIEKVWQMRWQEWLFRRGMRVETIESSFVFTYLTVAGILRSKLAMIETMTNNSMNVFVEMQLQFIFEFVPTRILSSFDHNDFHRILITSQAHEIQYLFS